MGATNSKRAQPQQPEAIRREHPSQQQQAGPSKAALVPNKAAAAAAAAPPIPARPQQSQQQQPHAAQAKTVKATTSPHSRRAQHYSSPLKPSAATAAADNKDLRTIQQNRSPRMAEYTSGGKQRAEKKKQRAADAAAAAAAAAAREAQAQDKENMQLCPPPVSAMLAASTPLAKSPSTLQNGPTQRHRAVRPLAAIPPPSASALAAATSIVPAVAAAPARRSSVEIAAAAAPQPVMRKVQVGPSRRSSEENVAAFTAAALASGAASVTVSASSSAAQSARSSAASSAASSNASSTDTSPAKNATITAATASLPIVFGASLAVPPAAAPAASMAATNKEGQLPIIARSPRGRSRSVVGGGGSLPAISPRPTHAAVAAAAAASSSSAAAGAAPIFSPATASRIARSSSVPPMAPSMARTSSAFRASFVSPPRNRGPALSGLPNSLPLDRFLDSWAWSPPLESADPFHPSQSHSVTLDPLRYGPSSRGLIMAMDRIALLTPTPSQMELLWNYTEGLGGHEPLPPAAATPAIPAGTASISRARLMLLASECSSKLHHQLVLQLKGKMRGGPRLKKWRSVLAVLERERPFFLPAPAPASPSDKKLESSVLLRAALGHSSAQQLAQLKSLTALIVSHLDLNGDGRVTKAEFCAGWSSMAAAVFGNVEHMGNAGVVSKKDGVISCAVM